MEPTTPTGPTIGDDEATHRADERRRRALEWSQADEASAAYGRGVCPWSPGLCQTPEHQPDVA